MSPATTGVDQSLVSPEMSQSPPREGHTETGRKGFFLEVGMVRQGMLLEAAKGYLDGHSPCHVFAKAAKQRCDKTTSYLPIAIFPIITQTLVGGGNVLS